MLRSGVMVAAFYYSKKAGVWANAEETERLYNDIKGSLQPHVQRIENQMPFEMPPLPQSGEVRYLAKHYYNNGVKNTFHFIDMLPCYTGQMVAKARLSIQEISRTTTKTE